MTDPPYLEVVGASKSFGSTLAVTDLSLSIRRGDVTVILGENGAGKSTLIKLLAGVHDCTTGFIRVQGHAESLSPKRAQELGVRVVHQELNLIDTLSVGDNIFLGNPVTKGGIGRLAGWRNEKAMEAKARSALAEIGLSLDVRLKVRDLSLAERQMVEIAKAVAFDARIIVMDEPTTALGPREKTRLFEVIRKLKSQNVGIVFVSHVLEDCIAIGDRFCVLRDGRKVGEFANDGLTAAHLVQLMAGRPIDQRFPEIRDKPSDGAALRVTNLSGPQVKDASFMVRRGEIFGFAGLVGSGRSELMRLVFGLDRSTAGKVELFGAAVRPTPKRMIAGGVLFLTEDRKTLGILKHMSVGENIAISALNLPAGSVLPRVRTLLGFRKGTPLTALIDTLLGRYRIKAPHAAIPITHLSGGNQQKVLLARAMATNVRILILDEPTKGIDAATKPEIYRILEGLSQEGISIIVISSELEEIMTLCSRIAIMSRGRIVRIVNRQESSASQVLQQALAA